MSLHVSRISHHIHGHQHIIRIAPFVSTAAPQLNAIRTRSCALPHSCAVVSCKLASWTSAASSNDDVESMKILAEWHKTGENGFDICPVKSKRWGDKATVMLLHIKASHMGDPVSMCKLGRAHEFGDFGLVKDQEEAFRWYEMASESLDADGMALAGDATVNGVGTSPNLHKGVALVAASAAMFSDYGSYLLGMYYYKGKRSGQELFRSDRKKAKFWLDRAIKSTNLSDGLLSTEHVNHAATLLETLQ